MKNKKVTWEIEVRFYSCEWRKCIRNCKTKRRAIRDAALWNKRNGRFEYGYRAIEVTTTTERKVIK
jgi:hypothetical protein